MTDEAILTIDGCKTLPLKFKRCNVFYQQVSRTGDTAIYSLSYCGYDSTIIGFDVVRVQKYTVAADSPFYADSNANPGDIVEYYPSSEQWGRLAWSYTTYAAAKMKFDELLELFKSIEKNYSCAA